MFSTRSIPLLLDLPDRARRISTADALLRKDDIGGIGIEHDCPLASDAPAVTGFLGCLAIDGQAGGVQIEEQDDGVQDQG